ncbi:MAG: Transcriptional regulator, AcrR family [uncultured Rubrobacteraceae bacterium]|uniref:Transcriptional regulator, AcrR family n=1 Tax=uncultured Rubrobacteraceae bacterium TaxID=349277 RepID=A0A6J4R397_9ACTN|nr:MAG: Transcriptional regulator, AcrR family [uncultured Rubrobacteraceae bacterium]
MEVGDTGSLGLRERTRRAVQTEIGDAAMRLFLERGFEATTMEQIANEVGISRRSLFRYFGTKEDIVLGHLVETGLAVRDALEARPADEGPWEALRAALESLALAPGYSPERTLKISKMLYGTPSLRAGHLEKRLRWQELLVPNIQKRLGAGSGDAPDPRARAIVACALTCLDVAGEIWTRHEGEEDLGRLFDRAVAAVRG